MAEEIITPETAAEEQQVTKPKKALIPFNVQPETSARFKSLVGKATDETLRKLLDAYEHAGEHTPDTPENVQQLVTENQRLEAELSEAKKSVQANTQTIKTLEKQVNDLTNQVQSGNQTETPEEIQKQIADLNNQISDLKNQVSDRENQIKELKKQPKPTVPESETVKNLQQTLDGYKNKVTELENANKELSTKASAAEEQTKQDRKVMDGYETAKKAADEELKSLRNQKKADDKTITDLRHQLANTAFQGYSGDDEFLKYFPELTAKLLDATAKKLSEARRDNFLVSPAMVLGDIFLKYTTQKRTMWFYRWVLGDDEIVSIAKTINPNIKSVSMLRRVLNIDQELN